MLEGLKGLKKYSSLDVAEVCNTLNYSQEYKQACFYKTTLYEIHSAKCIWINLCFISEDAKWCINFITHPKIVVDHKRSHAPLPYKGSFILTVRHFQALWMIGGMIGLLYRRGLLARIIVPINMSASGIILVQQSYPKDKWVSVWTENAKL